MITFEPSEDHPFDATADSGAAAVPDNAGHPAVGAKVRAKRADGGPTERMPASAAKFPGANFTATRRPASCFSLGRIHFSCPACRRPAVLARMYVGKRVSCPTCYTGIRVPDPVRRVPAQNLGRTVEPLLHPAAFARCGDAGQLVPWLVSWFPRRAGLVAAVGMLLLLAGLAALLPLTVRWAAQDRFSILRPLAVGVPLPDPGPGKSYEDEARAVVQAFLAAGTPGGKAAWVIDAAHHAPLMADWYAHRPGGGPQPEATITGISQGFYAAPGETVPVSEVTVDTPGEGELTYLVEHGPQGSRIAWPESVAYSPVEWSALLRQLPPGSPVPLRILACRDDYFNYSFAKEEAWCCLRLHDPRTKELLGYGYVPRTPFAAASLATAWPDPSGTVLRPVTLAVRPRPDSPATNQVEIVGPIAPGWKYRPAGTALAQR